jgi:hypothetical protein
VAAVPSIDELRTRAGEQGVHPSDDDLERVRAFLAVLLPAFEELERLIPVDAVPAAQFLPQEEP